MPYGCYGKIIACDLTEGNWQVIQVSSAEISNWLLGSGLAAKILYQELRPELDPLDPESPLILMGGLLTGTFVPGACKAAVAGRSPLTGIWNEATVGGFWGAELKGTGFDGLILKGKAPQPSYLFLHCQGLEIRPAALLWNLDCFAATEALWREVGKDARVGTIGLAGTNLSRMASIIFDGRKSRAAGRGGMGAILGSKNLKAIVVKGEAKPAIAHPDRLRKSIRTNLEKIRAMSRGLSSYGTAGGLAAMEYYGALPIKNWRERRWEEGVKKTGGEAMASQLVSAHQTCFSCPIRCSKEVKVTEGMYAGLEGHGPEYETTAGFGALLLNQDLESILAANELCNRYGLDTISTSSVIAFAIEAKERGLLPRVDRTDPNLDWGNHRAIIDTIHLIAHRQGLGELLADGVRAAAERIGGGAAEFAIHTKGLEVPYYDPRTLGCMAVNYATANRGACHLESLSYYLVYGVPLLDFGYEAPPDPQSDQGKAKLCYDLQNYMAVYNPLGICKFLFGAGVGPKLLAEWTNAVMDWDLDMAGLMRMGERLFNLKRLFNVRLGISRKDDTLPLRLLSPEWNSEGDAGHGRRLEKMLSEYYQLRGWDQEGIPRPEKLEHLGLLSLAEEQQIRRVTSG